jgi:hypothetical protein
MTVVFTGVLKVKELTGRRGAFLVGDLVTELGTFKIKDQILDQFAEGEYRGRFAVSRIFPDAYVHYGRVITEIRADVAEIHLDEVEPGAQQEDIPAEPDPLDRAEQSVSTAPPAPVEQKEEPAASGASSTADADSLPAADSSGLPAEDVALFGEELAALIAQGANLKLDTTVDRERFRHQCRRLRQPYGYDFEAKSQTWFKPGA